jgi:glycosyltransferase involved in cell wall biosynthesis
MKVLHLFSDWRWTGPAEPTVDLCRALAKEGVEVALACRRPVEGYPQSIRSKARERGVPTLTDLHLNRYLNAGETLSDLVRLGPYLRRWGCQLVHCHLSHDHFLGGWSSRRCDGVIPVIRTNHKARPIRPSLGNRWLLRRWTDGLIEFSRRAAQEDRMSFGLPAERVIEVEGSIDLGRFSPVRVNPDIRGQLGIGGGDVLVGIVARMQRHRRFELLLEAMRILRERAPEVKLMVLGRGTHRQAVAVEPARRLGVEDAVLFPGYRGEDYVDHLAAMDIKVFLVPGSDGTCRAVREAMAMGKPVVATKRGMLPEILEHGRTGLLVDENPSAIAEAIERLARDRVLREGMGAAARSRALKDFSMEAQAKRVAWFYEELLAMGPWTS